MSNLKFGIVGTGAIGKEHMERLANKINGSEVVAVTDVNQAGAEEAVKILGINARVFANDDELIADPNVDAVVVTSPGFAHESTVLKAIAAGKPVFVEKPLAMTIKSCRNIMAAEEKAGKRLVQVGFQRRYDSGYKKLKDAVDSGFIGEPLMVHCSHRNATVPESYTTDMAIKDTMVHEIDALNWLLGAEYASIQVLFPKKTKLAFPHLADPQLVIMETKGGVLITVEIFVNCQFGYDIQCEVVGTEGTVKLPNPESLVFKKNEVEGINLMNDWKLRFIDSYDVEFQQFVHDVKATGSPTGPTSWDGYVAALVCEAGVQSQERGEKVIVVLEEKPNFYK